MAPKTRIDATQEVTSAATSIKQIPATFKLVAWKKGTVNFDMGCGKWPELFTEALAEVGVTNIPYDPHHVQENKGHRKALTYMGKKSVDTVTCNNVLNVLKEDHTQENTIKHCLGVLRVGGIAYFLIYEGDKSGTATPTKKGWQNNKAAETYVAEIQKVFPFVQRKGNLIAASDSEQDMGLV